MQPNFTPGPWHLGAAMSSDFDHIRYVTGDDGNAVAEVRSGTFSRQPTQFNQDIALANSRLIGAAPDMFRALNSLAVNLRALGFGGDEEISGADTVDAVAEAFADIEAALAKAGGRS